MKFNICSEKIIDKYFLFKLVLFMIFVNSELEVLVYFIFLKFVMFKYLK